MDLRRDVEGRGRLVGDDEGRAAREGHGDQHALAHAAGQLERIPVDQGVRFPQPHGPEAAIMLSRRFSRGTPRRARCSPN
jgi:hypothetical protein